MSVEGDRVSESLTSLIPVELAEPGDRFMPCPKTLVWIRKTFLSQDSPLYNVEHDHLNSANIGLLWTNVPRTRQMKPVAASAELGTPPMGLSGWARERWKYQNLQWFGDDAPDFILTFYAPYMAGANDLTQFSTIEHELFHCGHKRDGFDCPKFRKNGMPVFGIRGHGVEEFPEIIRRYGIEAGAGESVAFVEAARTKPEIGMAVIRGLCGTCK